MKKLFSCAVIVALAVTLLAGADKSFAQAACVNMVNGIYTTQLTWTNTDTVDQVTVLRATTLGGPYAAISTLVPGALLYTDTVAKPATGSLSYYYVVQNVNTNSGGSAYSNEVCKTFFSIPVAPSTLTAK